MDKKQIALDVTDLGNREVQFCISNQEQDRDGDILVAAGCDLTQFQKNPQFLGFHNYWDYPLGKVVKCWIDNASNSVKAIVYFPTVEELSTNPDQASEKAKQVDFTYNCYKTGLLKAVSVGFQVKDFENNPDSEFGHIITKWELLEFSAVPVPANPDALAESVKSFDPSGDMMKMFNFETKGVIPFKKYPLADEDTAWDGNAVVKASEIEDLQKICTWVADKPKEDLTKGDFKLPHHLSKADGYKTCWKGVAAAMSALLGGRGGVDVPEADKDKIYNHLAKHYKEFGKDVPEKSISDMQTKTGARLSKETMKAIDEIKACHKEMKACHDRMDKALKALMPDDEETPAPEGDDTSKDIDISSIELKSSDDIDILDI